jgi:NADH-quinone oxidoreductase subunit A
MTASTPSPSDFLPILIALGVALGFVVSSMVGSHLLGPIRKTKKKQESYECGVEITGNARIPFSIKYFIVAILFVLFDVEVIFMYPWAVNFRQLGLFGFYEMALFMGFVLVGFIYMVRKGALKWE